jgi:hypothetical protein
MSKETQQLGGGLWGNGLKQMEFARPAVQVDPATRTFYAGLALDAQGRQYFFWTTDPATVPAGADEVLPVTTVEWTFEQAEKQARDCHRSYFGIGVVVEDGARVFSLKDAKG